jgi:hypothetical protein
VGRVAPAPATWTEPVSLPLQILSGGRGASPLQGQLDPVPLPYGAFAFAHAFSPCPRPDTSPGLLRSTSGAGRLVGSVKVGVMR